MTSRPAPPCSNGMPSDGRSVRNLDRLRVEESDTIFELEIPHPLKTLAWRPRRYAPKFKPPAVAAADRGIPRSILEGWHSPRILADSDAGAVSIDFKYCHVGGATATFSEKARRQQFMSGPHEKARWRMLESCATVVDFQFHPFTIVWKTALGGERSYTPDSLELHRDGRLVAREEKADQAYYEEPETADLHANAEAFLATKGVEFKRSLGEPDPLAFMTHKEIAGCRRFDFSVPEIEAVCEDVATGSSNVGRLVDAIGGHPEVAAVKLRAMAARGLVDISTLRPWTRGTPAGAVSEPVAPHRLREFLRENATGPSDAAS